MTGSIETMSHEIEKILNRQLHSMWIYGSVVLNDFRLGWSDIDFIAFADEPISETQAEQLVALRQTLSNKFPNDPFYPCFEGVIVNLREFLTNNYTKLVYWGTSGQRVTDIYELDAFSRYELAKYGRSVCGNDDRYIFAIPDRNDLISAVKHHYESIRKYAVRTNESIYSCGWLLDIARCIYTLRDNDIMGKTQAGIRALNEHIFPNEDALRQTLDIRQHPIKYKYRDDIKRWLSELVPTVQQYADILAKELEHNKVDIA